MRVTEAAIHALTSQICVQRLGQILRAIPLIKSQPTINVISHHHSTHKEIQQSNAMISTAFHEDCIFLIIPQCESVLRIGTREHFRTQADVEIGA